MKTDHRVRQRLSALACSLLLAGATSLPSARAQDAGVPSAEAFDPFSPARPPAPALPESSRVPAPAAPVQEPVVRAPRAVTLATGRGERVSATPVRLSAEQQRTVEAAGRALRQLSDQSLDSYRRGLLPLEDFAEMQSATVSLAKSVSRLTGRDGDLSAALERQVRQTAVAATDLRDIRQPGAWNYDADRTLTELLSLDARRNLAELRGDRTAAATALRQRSQLAQRNWEIRKEYLAAGMSDFFQLAQAAELATAGPSDSSGKPTAETIAGWEAFRPQLASAVQGVERLGTAAATLNGGGLGRADQVALARFSLASLDCRLAVAREDASAARSAMQSALDSSREAFSLQSDYQTRGTATIYDLARTLRMRSDLLNQPGIQAAETLQQELSGDLQSVARLAEQTVDDRGRRSADVSFVQAVVTQNTVRGWLKN